MLRFDRATYLSLQFSFYERSSNSQLGSDVLPFLKLLNIFVQKFICVFFI